MAEYGLGASSSSSEEYYDRCWLQSAFADLRASRGCKAQRLDLD